MVRQRNFEDNAVSYSRGIPIAFKEAKGVTLKDVDENIYRDFFWRSRGSSGRTL